MDRRRSRSQLESYIKQELSRARLKYISPHDVQLLNARAWAPLDTYTSLFSP